MRYVGYLNLGGTYNDLGRFSEAIEPLKKSAMLHPSFGAYTNLGTSYFGLHRSKEAAAAYLEAIKLDPKQYVTWGNLGFAQYYAGNPQELMKSYREAAELAAAELKVNSHDVDVLSDLAQYESMLGDRVQALMYLEKALEYGHGEKDLLRKSSRGITFIKIPGCLIPISFRVGAHHAVHLTLSALRVLVQYKPTDEHDMNERSKIYSLLNVTIRSRPPLYGV